MISLSQILSKYKFPLLLSAVIIVSVWPFSFYVFPLKWDNIDCYLPYKYFWTSTLLEGNWPWWNPYQYFGYPAYSDMQNGMWNPITWLMVLLFGKYSVISLSTELTVYFLIAGLGMYKFSKLISDSPYVRFFCGISFALSGFMVGTTQIMIFLMGAAWLPWILYCVWKLHESTQLKHAILLGIFIALQTTSASPCYTIILLYILIAGFVYSFWKAERKLRLTMFYGVGAVVAILLVAPMIVGFMEFKPYFGRLGKLPYDPWIYEGSFDFAEYVSFLFPMSVLSKSELWGPTDLTLRNGYFGIFGCLFFIVGLLNFRASKKVLIFFLGAILFLLLAAGDYTPLYKLVYHLPGFGTFRHPSFFRSHALFFMILIAGIGLNHFLKERQNLKPVLLSLGGLTILGFVYALKDGTDNVYPLINDLIDFKGKPDYFTSPFLLLNAVIVVLFLGVFWLLRKKLSPKLIMFFVISDLFLQTMITAPTTMISRHNTMEDFNEFYEQLPSEIDQRSLTTPLKKLHGKIDFINKYPVWRNIGTFTKSITPKGHNAAQFKEFNTLENNGGLENVIQNPLFFVAKTKVDSAQLATQTNTVWGTDVVNDKLQISNGVISANSFGVNVQNQSPDKGLVVLNQNYHHLWKASIQNKPVEVIQVNDGLMAVEVPANYSGWLQFDFDTSNTKIAIWIMVLAYLFTGYFFWHSQI